MVETESQAAAKPSELSALLGTRATRCVTHYDACDCRMEGARQVLRSVAITRWCERRDSEG